jgi:UDPglucose 6-dehydrogenase
MKYNVGFMGLGKLGLPVATTMALRGANVTGFDLDPKRMSYTAQPYQETGPDGTGDFNEWLALAGGACESSFLGQINFGSVEQICAHADLIFVAVQTPHDPRYEGTTKLDDQPVDFDYTYLKKAIELLVPHVSKPTPIVVISTVLPGTMQREIKPILEQNKNMRLVYNPAFIAMGTTMYDFLNPEFVLLGVDDVEAAELTKSYYQSILPGKTICSMSVPSAELTKVAYNTAISQKIALANTIMEICHKTPGADVNDVTAALKCANRRVVGPSYMDGGMGDGGGCHPRDNIALSWLARKLSLSYDIFWSAMQARERQSEWMRNIITQAAGYYGLPLKQVTILGYAYKPGTNITTGSPAILLKNQLTPQAIDVQMWDPHVNKDDTFADLQKLKEPSVFFIGCCHAEFVGWDLAQLPPGSIVIDPFRIVQRTPHHNVIRIGEWPEAAVEINIQKEMVRRMTPYLYSTAPKKKTDFENRHGAK